MIELIASLEVGRLVFVLLVLLVYFGISFLTKKWFFSSIAFLLFLLPFNITFQLTNLPFISEEYIQGIVSNYTIPTLHFLDVFVFIVLIIILKKKLITNLFQTEKIFFLCLFFLFTIKAVVDWEMLSVITVYRLFFYAFTIYISAKYFLLQYSFSIREKQILTFILLITIIIQFGIGLGQFLQGSSLGLSFLGESQIVKGMYGTSFVELQNQVFLRAYGTFPHPNVLAGYLFFLLPVCFSFLKGYLRYISLTLVVILIFLTFSRIAIFLSLGFFLVLFLKYFWNKIGGFIPLFFDRFLNFDHGLSDRIELVKNGFEIIKNYPLWGIGASQYVYGIDYYPVYTAGGFLLLEPVHNIYILLLAEYGLVLGIPLVLCILYFLFRNFLKGELFLKYTVFGILIISMLDHYFITLPQGILLFLMVISFGYIYTLRIRSGCGKVA